MFLNKKGWRTFMSICVCIAVLCLTNKQSASLGDRGRGNRLEGVWRWGSHFSL